MKEGLQEETTGTCSCDDHSTCCLVGWWPAHGWCDWIVATGVRELCGGKGGREMSQGSDVMTQISTNDLSFISWCRTMIFTTLKGVASRRPLSTITAATTASSLSYAFYIEHGNSKPTSYIPRHHYDAIAIEKYWTERPLSAARRIIDIACELGPVAVEYLYKFHLRPRLFVGSECNNLRCEAIGSDEDETRQLSQKLRDALTNLGPTFIKVGQQLSIRPDLVSPIVLYELQRLCDAVPPFDCQVAMKVLAQELPSTNAECDNNSLSTQDVDNTILHFFQEMPQLVASASLGQVYKAKLRNTNSQHQQDQEVAIKIQRPDIFETVTLDLFLLITYGKTVDKLCSLFTNQIPYHENFLNGFSSGAFMELNYVNEAENQLFFRKELHERFNGQTDCTNAEKKQSILSFLRAHSIFPSEKVVIPNVYSQYTTERILVTEWIDGKPLAQCPTEQIRELIPVGVELFLCQLLDIGKFHADPHPGSYQSL